MLIPFDHATTLLLEVFRQWNFVADFQWILVKISVKNDKFEYLNPIFGKLEMTHDLGSNPMVDFLFVLIELVSLFITFPEFSASSDYRPYQILYKPTI